MAFLVALMLLPGGAAAADKYHYRIYITPASGTDSGATPDGSVVVDGLDTTKTVRVRILRGGVLIPGYTHDYGTGTTEASFSADEVTGGDVVEVQQPQGAVAESFSIPNVSLAGSIGSANVTGHAPDGSYAVTSYEAECFGSPEQDIHVTPQGGAFSATYPRALSAGGGLELRAFPGKGDSVTFYDRLPGETPCLEAYATDGPTFPGQPVEPTPYRIQADNLRGAVAPSARIVLRRAGVVIAEYSDASATSSISQATANRPSAGDVMELYRPQGAPAPTSTFTIPSVKAIFDRSNSLVAVDAPAATRLDVDAYVKFQMWQAGRTTRNTVNGRTIFNFAVGQATEPALDLSIPDFLFADWRSEDQHGRIEVNVQPGDLAAPTLGIKLASKFKLAKLGSSFPATISSNEAGPATVSLTLPAKLKGDKSHKAKKPRKVASAKLTFKAGSNKVKVKITKAGKKLLKSIRKKHLPTQTATLTVTQTDAAGNVATKVKTTKLVSK
jgi:hypothetical protein